MAPLRRRRSAPALALVGGLALLLPLTIPAGAAEPGGDGNAAQAPTSTPAQVDAPVPELDWGPCGEGFEDFQCATAEVPTDYDNPDGSTTTIALTRLPATNQDEKIGTLFTNPGGPGGSGVQFVQQVGKGAYTDDVRERFDILGFDPRAVAGSDPATCFRTQEQENEFLAGAPSVPLTADEERDMTSTNLRLVRNCDMTSAERFAHSSTANVARDMDLLRQAVGDEQLNYVGYSYGTVLGATYGQLFPDRIRALVLDGTLDPEKWSGSEQESRSIGVRTGQGPGGHETFAEFNRLCADAGPQHCPIAALGDPATVTDELFERLKTEPATVELPDGTTVTLSYGDVVLQTFFGLYEPVQWPGLADLLATLATDDSDDSRPTLSADAADVVKEADQTTDRKLRRGNDYASVGGSLASMCMDTGQTGSPYGYPDLADAEDEKAPHFGRARAWVGQTCEFMDIDDDDAYTGPWQQEVDEPVMVIGTRFDPATPYAMTEPYADDFPDARVLTLDGWGHTVLGKSSCADAAVSDYLLTGEAQDGATCEPDDTTPFVPDTTAERDDEPPIQVPPGLPKF